MHDLIRLFFNPPPIPTLEIPVILRPARVTIEKALELMYFRGWYDGLLLGLIIALLLIPRKGK